MNKFLLLAAVAVAFCAVVVVAQHPHHCDAPWEFEAHGLQYDRKEDFGRRGRIFYDAENERTALIEEVENGTDREYYHTIHLFREHHSYYYNLKTKVCDVRSLDFPFRPIHIPHNASFVREAIVGTNAFPNSGVLTTHWEHHSDTDPKFRWFGVFTARDVGCVPVSDFFHDERIGTMHTEFFDVVLGIGDPDVFIPNSVCPHPQKIVQRIPRKH